jgi:predicted ATP-grasp superfamily ATP-dependent carboligase
MIKIDVKQFFPSVPQYKVMHFFRDVLECGPDVAGLLANLVCYDGRLATGSSASPIISYYANKQMFDQIEQIAAQNELKLTCYVDDLTLSGPKASRRVLHDVRRIIMRTGLRTHKGKYFEGKGPKLVTGVMVGLSGLYLPFSRRGKIRADEILARETGDPAERAKVLRRLVSRLYEASQLDSSCRQKAETYHQELRQLQRELTDAA